MIFKRKLPIPQDVKKEFPLSDELAKIKAKNDAEIKKIFDEQYEAASKNAKIAVEEKLVLEYLCRQLGVELTYGEYKKLRGDDFQKYATYYYYYFGITSEAQVEEYFGREQLVLQFKHEMVLKLLTEKVVFE